MLSKINYKAIYAEKCDSVHSGFMGKILKKKKKYIKIIHAQVG